MRRERDWNENPIDTWDGNIRMNMEEIDVSVRNWMDLTKARDYRRALENASLNLRVE